MPPFNSLVDRAYWLFVEPGSLIGSMVLASILCSLPPKWLPLKPKKAWRIAGAVIGAVLGLLLAPLSMFTFGVFGFLSAVSVGELSKSVAAATAAKTVLVPISVALGAGIVSLSIAGLFFGAIATVQRFARNSF